MAQQTKGTDEEIVKTTLRLRRSELDKAKIQAIKEHMSLQEWILKAMQFYMKGGRP